LFVFAAAVVVPRIAMIVVSPDFSSVLFFCAFDFY